MRPAVEIKGEIGDDLRVRIAHQLAALQVNLFVFEAAPKPLDEDVVQALPLPSIDTRTPRASAAG